MCGIGGFIHKSECDSFCDSLEQTIHSLQSCRGPDSCGSEKIKIDQNTVHLLHQRLRIQDLTSMADQPMKSQLISSSTIVFNGEIYNVSDIQAKFIDGLELKTKSDTEVFIESLVSSGMENVLPEIRGMFALGYLDSERKTLSLARDRFGEKPLHYFSNNDFFIFASQFDVVAECMRILDIPRSISIEGVREYFLLGYFPYDQSLVKGIRKLQPGSILNVQLNDSLGFRIASKRWIDRWKVKRSDHIELDAAREILQQAVKIQLIGDVSIGVFLSGGCDSTLISMLAQELVNTPIHSFSVGFENHDYDESDYALKASMSIGTIHHPMIMTSADAKEILPDVLDAFPEPLGDPSVIPTTFLCREAKKHVTVTLTGDGADELFFGYGRYARFLELEKIDNCIPKNNKIRSLLLQLVKSWRIFQVGSLRSRRIEAFFSNRELGSRYTSLVGFSHLDLSLDESASSEFRRKYVEKLWRRGFGVDAVTRLREIDVDSYLTDDILVKVDRAAMKFSLETRAPFLDPKVADLASRCDISWLATKQQKYLIKKILSQKVPSEIYDRPKKGFGPPLMDWLNTELKSWAEEIIYGFPWDSVELDSKKVHSFWENRNQDANSATYLWILLVLAHAVKRITN